MKIGRFGRCLILLLALAGLCAVGLPLAANPNEQYITDKNPIQAAEASRGGTLWVLDFKFKGPRLIKVNIPGRGQKVCWYIWYQIINRTNAPRTFIPDFELVTHDTRMTYRDQILPAAQEAISKVEDPTGYPVSKIKNSVTIASDPIPESKEKAAPRPVTGVAIWTDPNDISADDDEATRKRKEGLPKLADSNNYTIFVAGLSNGWSLTDPIPPDKAPVVRRKTLQLPFKRLGGKELMRSGDIQYQPPHDWIYRASKLNLNLPGKAKEAPAVSK